jgi:small-conductance mechanosensitive channel
MKTFAVVGAVLALAIGIPVGCSLIGAGASVGTAPGRMVSDTMRTQNIKQSYEYFHDASNNFEASVAQVTQYKAFVSRRLTLLSVLACASRWRQFNRAAVILRRNTIRTLPR